MTRWIVMFFVTGLLGVIAYPFMQDLLGYLTRKLGKARTAVQQEIAELEEEEPQQEENEEK